MIKYGLAEKYVRIVHDMYDGSTTAVMCAVGVTEGFEVKLALHQGSALSPCLFAMVMDRMTSTRTLAHDKLVPRSIHVAPANDLLTSR